MACSKAESKISGDKESPCFKHLETVKSFQVKWNVYTIEQSVFSWYKHGVALFTTLFHSNRCLDPEFFFNSLILK